MQRRRAVASFHVFLITKPEQCFFFCIETSWSPFAFPDGLVAGDVHFRALPNWPVACIINSQLFFVGRQEKGEQKRVLAKANLWLNNWTGFSFLKVSFASCDTGKRGLLWPVPSSQVFPLLLMIISTFCYKLLVRVRMKKKNNYFFETTVPDVRIGLGSSFSVRMRSKHTEMAAEPLERETGRKRDEISSQEVLQHPIMCTQQSFFAWWHIGWLTFVPFSPHWINNSRFDEKPGFTQPYWLMNHPFWLRVRWSLSKE